MNRIHFYSITALLLAMPMALVAQNDTIRRTVRVESIYNPVLASSEKRSFLPEEQQLVTNREKVVYADESHDPGNLSRDPFGSGVVALRQERLLPAYLRLGYGNRNNVDALGLYRATLSRNDVINVGASVKGWNGNIPFKGLTAPVDSGSWKSLRYDTDAQISYAHEGHTRFGLAADAGYYMRNYLVANPLMAFDTDQQNCLTYGANGYISTSLKKVPLNVGLSGGYHRWQNSAWQGMDAANAENHAELDANLAFRLKKAGRLELALTNDYLAYSNLPDTVGHYFLGIHPQWIFEGKWGSIALGLNADVQTTDSLQAQFSPNCRFTLTPAAPLRLDLIIDGGRDLQTFRELYCLSPWWTADIPLQRAYTYLNSRLHAGVRVAEGFHLGFGGGYRITDDALFATEHVKRGLLYTGLVNHDTQVWNANADISYEWKDLFRFTTDFTYYGWLGMDDTPALLAFAPQMDWNTSVRARIIRSLHADAAFRYRQFCDTGAGCKDAVADLSLKADYAFNRIASLYISGENLLNRQSGFCPAIPAQGIRVVGGVVLKL